ncbi:hypothetical protein LguiB_016607 [Lonicera macranthoides]
MATVSAAHRPDFLRESSSYFMKNHHNFPRIPDWTVRMNPQSSQRKNREELSTELQKLSFPHLNGSAIPSELRFNRLQPAKQVSIREHKIEFGDFVVREAVLDEEFWQHGCEQKLTRKVDQTTGKEGSDQYESYRTEERSWNPRSQHRKLAARSELSGGKKERVKASLFCSINKKGPRYGYIANLCVSQSARRQRIASNMLNLAIRSAKSNGEMLKLNSSLGFLSQCQYLGKYLGAEQVFVHVHKNNKPAHDLYQKLGFEVVEIAGPQFSAEQTHLLPNVILRLKHVFVQGMAVEEIVIARNYTRR